MREALSRFAKCPPHCGSFQRLLPAAANWILPAGTSSHRLPHMSSQHMYGIRRHSHQLPTYSILYDTSPAATAHRLVLTCCCIAQLAPSSPPYIPPSDASAPRLRCTSQPQPKPIRCTVLLGVLALLLLLLFVVRVLRLPKRVYPLFRSLLSFLFLIPSYIPQPHTLVRFTHPPHLPLPLSHTHYTITLHSLTS